MHGHELYPCASIDLDVQDLMLDPVEYMFAHVLCPYGKQPYSVNCSVALNGLGVPSAAVAACRQFVLYVPGEAESALQRLRPILEGKLADTAGTLSLSLDHLQVLS